MSPARSTLPEPQRLDLLERKTKLIDGFSICWRALHPHAPAAWLGDEKTLKDLQRRKLVKAARIISRYARSRRKDYSDVVRQASLTFLLSTPFLCPTDHSLPVFTAKLAHEDLVESVPVDRSELALLLGLTPPDGQLLQHYASLFWPDPH